jgi:hypothetical protein
MVDGAEGGLIEADPAGVIHVDGEGEAGLDGAGARAGAVIEGDEVAELVLADGDVGELVEEAEDGLGDGVLVEWGGGAGDDVPEYWEEFPPGHGERVGDENRDWPVF